MNTLFILNDPPYGTERSYNAIRLATALAKREGQSVRVFLMGDAAAVARSGQRVPQGYYNLERMLELLTSAGAQVAACGTCMDARGITSEDLVPGARKSTLSELTDWTLWAGKVVVF
ncbi:MAG TPA: DsrE family protein [Gemmatimonadales bacterium]|nr:DsrE family protein [Gemmatimonadales bacterium]